ncbi:Ubiquitin-conjugating enzyme E2 J1 [Erysiphe neolycopersici]|uniref:Ubiquitin-conjugating enzyme E2 J1 n=1 Tax=Erysiphe neolycopersici TaxID=212602 RepID=A0A420HEJ3_9PEZI|nr:Ubiquitin-conjugating enzyme E2 J1 [Erysiphe neolycopersici]
MATSKYARSPTIKRILREAAELAQSPSPDFYAAPVNDSDLFDWHFTIRGPPSSVYENGIYHGRILLPPTYPLRPPSFRFLNSSGRFEVNREICLSISGHHEETWMPAWGLRTALVALRSFMETDPKGQLGGLECTANEREKIARESVNWVCNVCQKKNIDILRESQKYFGEMDLDTMNTIETKIFTPENKVAMISIPDGDKGEEEKISNNGGIVVETKLQEKVGKNSNELPATNLPSNSNYTISEYSETKLTPISSSATSSTSHLNTRVTQPSQTTPTMSNNEDSPLWIDRAIATIIFCLVAMVMKVLLGLGGQSFPWESR